MTTKYRFTNDGDGHWYMIPAEMLGEFYEMLEEAESKDEYSDFNNKFYSAYYIGCHPNNYTFENPKDE